MKYIVRDWAGNVMNWGEYSDIDDAFADITMHAFEDMEADGLDIEDDSDQMSYNLDQYCGEYWVDEIPEL